jgi:tRNA pseudouridine55 synthase
MNEEKQPTILLIDKPSGITSHDVVNQVRAQTGVKRVGHAGTLDPLATGLLIILVGRESTKKQSEYLHQDKEYVCTAQLGVETDSYDKDGKTTATAEWSKVAQISKENFEAALASFRGQISQVVPAYSAVKVKGRKLYEKARQGKVVDAELPSRLVHIYELELIDVLKNDKAQKAFFTIRVKCSSGTYIRSLVHDIGKHLQVGATVTALRRTKIGEVSVEQAQQLE